ncbi:unnamed protein product, partial [Mesorhabditis belari]|uniref:Uncharacterized protein n=1 Tax=Mesorhabditis belari TaxID=2138241 RepID=A0AAF3F2Q4_9BILA
MANYCNSDADCVQMTGEACKDPRAICQCNGGTFCTLKKKCDPSQQGSDCPKNNVCALYSPDDAYYCRRQMKRSVRSLNGWIFE